eukprot:gene18730-biopygen3965
MPRRLLDAKPLLKKHQHILKRGGGGAPSQRNLYSQPRPAASIAGGAKRTGRRDGINITRPRVWNISQCAGGKQKWGGGGVRPALCKVRAAQDERNGGRRAPDVSRTTEAEEMEASRTRLLRVLPGPFRRAPLHCRVPT